MSITRYMKAYLLHTNKLRTYRTFKNIYSTEPYVRIIAQKKFRSAYAKFRSGVAPINIELCRYGLARIPVEERVCSHCNEVEDESHVLMYCPLYDDIRDQLTLSINDINPSLQDSSVQDQFIQLMCEHNYNCFLYIIGLCQRPSVTF